jgi:hypothetical protein
MFFFSSLTTGMGATTFGITTLSITIFRTIGFFRE